MTFTDFLFARQANEKSAFNVVTKFWNDATETWTASTPTTVKYRIDDPEQDCQIVDWTTATPGTSVTIPITTTANTIQNNCRQFEKRQLTVKADDALSSQYQETYCWTVKNLAGQT